MHADRGCNLPAARVSSANYFFPPWLLAIASISRCICSYSRFISGSLILGRSARPDMRRIMRCIAFMR